MWVQQQWRPPGEKGSPSCCLFFLSSILRPAQWPLVAFRSMWTPARVHQGTYSRTSDRDGRFALQFSLHYQRLGILSTWGGRKLYSHVPLNVSARFPVGLSGLDQEKPDPKCTVLFCFLGQWLQESMWMRQQGNKEERGGGAAMQMRNLTPRVLSFYLPSSFFSF